MQVPRDEARPPETLTDIDYANLLRVPDRPTIAGKRDYALLRVLGDCGLRSAELRGLRARDLRRPRTNAHHHHFFVHGKGGHEREVPVPEAVQHALQASLKVHPLRILSRSPQWPCTGSSGGCAWPRACRSGSRTRTRSGPTGPRTCSRPAFSSTRSRNGSGTRPSHHCAIRRGASGARGRHCRCARPPPPSGIAGGAKGVGNPTNTRCPARFAIRFETTR